MDLADEYLGIPDDYAAHLGGLRWAVAGDALDLADGTTFAFTFQIGAFLEGYLSRGPLIHFGFVVVLLDFLRRHDPPHDRGLRGLVQEAFSSTGRMHRNAGAFFAGLCRDVPPAPGPPVGADLIWRLQYPPHPREVGAALAAPWSTGRFEGHIHRALNAYGFDDLLHWFRHGAGPVKHVAQFVEAIVARPPSLAGVLADLARDARLAAAAPYLGRFVGALTLPRRRLARHDLPLGGYDDIATRGDMAQVLPAQLALEADEFVRRFAERELLFFRREEPHARTREELVVLLDQGVRTWGVVRLMLAAAALALGRFAERRRLSLRVAATSSPATLDPLTADGKALAALVGASDLTAHPGVALERVLEEAGAEPRDVVLLTHPRNLSEPDVAAAARRLTPEARLFALTVTASGAAELSEMRHGAPIALSRFKVEAEAIEPERIAASARATDVPPWTGDVEPVPFPFRFGTGGGSEPLRFAFDHAGEWLLTATASLVFATRTDGTDWEILPRPKSAGVVLNDVRDVLGVAGGFAVVGRYDLGWWIAHYDLGARTCRVYRIAKPRGAPNAVAYYFRKLHLIAVGQGSDVRCLDLGTGSPCPWPNHAVWPLDFGNIVSLGSGKNVRGLRPCGMNAPTDNSEPWQLFLHLSPQTGSLELRNAPGWGEFTPLADGRPLLKGCELGQADCQADTLAAVFMSQTGERILRVFRGPDGMPVSECRLRHIAHRFALSDDGRLLAVQVASGKVEIRLAQGRGPALTVTPAGRYHADVRATLGDGWIVLNNNVAKHLVRWDKGRLEVEAVTNPNSISGGLAVESKTLPPWLFYDPRRFVGVAHGWLVAALDLYGQLALFEANGQLVCMFFSFRHQLAAWLPDGTRLGPAALLGGPPTPGAAEKIGQTLKAAWDRAQRRTMT